ncbi:hypothetical protein JX266_006204 [Neoarthrinium moseri]|uniref:uncharacterized protein n=1 Tax=Neoarthrinium moseri TaxID=1658444 RepID=UPI001FDE903C|nr:uncharacterized protein JN550_011746 [Neoarthrinium moseri]KAI1847709.1 hypothetical protein JX266_006204 [Neoarthrinium moseri]KAI1859935.1 hypothetical protein JN550_011746 [Neoarthrinium moseri]
MSGKNSVPSDFASYYLQQATKELAEDLDKVRGADDFKGDALPLLIKALQQGTALFSPADQQRIVEAGKKQTTPNADDDTSSSGSSSTGSDEEQ